MADAPNSITCDEPVCTAEYAMLPGEGYAGVHMRASDSGWTWTGRGTDFRDWCPDHRKPGAQPESFQEWQAREGRTP